MRALSFLLPFALLLAACDSNQCEAEFGDLVITEIKEGEGLAARAYDAPTVAYAGFLDDDTQVFTDTITFGIDHNEVIEGFNEGIKGLKVGGKRRVIVPSGRAFGCQGTQSVPSNSTITFEMELLDLDRVQITDITIGSGDAADADDAAVVTYVGTLTNDAVFDSGTIQFTLGSNRIITGFSAGVAGMKVGGKRRVTVPPSLAYGPSGTNGIPPNSTLVFEITLNTLTKY